MKKLIIIVAFTVALVAVMAAQAHNTKWSWAESHAETRVVKTVLYHLPNMRQEEEGYQALISMAQQELDAAKRCGDPCLGAQMAAMQQLVEARQALAELRRGYPVVDATCTGSGAADRTGIRFKHFRCVVIVESQSPGTDFIGRGRIYVHARDKMRMYYQWI
jgi:hypothetical protein